MAVYKIRWSYAIGTSLTAPVLIGLIIIAVLRPLALGACVAVILAVINVFFTVRRMRRRWLATDDFGLQIQRDKYALKVPWDAITSVRRRRLQGILAVDEFMLAHSEVIGRTSRGKFAPPPPRLEQVPESTERIQVSVYDKNWRDGPIGDALRKRGIGLADEGPAEPSAEPSAEPERRH